MIYRGITNDIAVALGPRRQCHTSPGVQGRMARG